MSKTVFIIKRAYVSNGLKKTYFKKLEIIEAVTVDTKVYMGEKLHYKLKSGWKTKNIKDRIRTNDIIRSTPSIEHARDDLVYESFDLAYIAKVTMIQKMKREYMKALEDLKATMERNCPDMKNELEEIQEKYPEHMI